MEERNQRTEIDEQEQRASDEDPAVSTDERVVAKEEVVTSSPGARYLARGWVSTMALMLLVALAAVESLLAFRLGFLLAGANPNNGFVDFIYDVSAPFVDAFEGIIATEAVNGGVLEPASVIAMIVYLVATLLFIAVVFAILSKPAPAGERGASSKHVR